MFSISIQNLSFTYEGASDAVFEGLSLQLDARWKLGCIGRNGRGKTTLLRLLSGQLQPQAGQIAAPVGFELFPFEVPRPQRTVEEVLFSLSPQAETWELQRELSLLQVREDGWRRPFCTLSGGEQAKVLLAGLFCKPGRFLLIDEPTNHLDLQARQVVCQYLRRTEHGFILVSHDRAFLDGCIDHVLAFNREGVQLQRGNFSSWYENKRRQDEWERAQNRKLEREIDRLSEAADRAGRWSDKTEKSKKGAGAKQAGLRPDRGYVGHKAAKMMKRSKSIEARRRAAAEEKAGLLRQVETAEALAIHPLPYRGPRLAEARELAIAYGGVAVNRPLTFALHPGERVALLGGNGAGKSSILRLLLGQEVPHEGRLTTGSGLIISYLPQDAGALSGDLRSFIRARGIDETLFKAILRKLDFSRAQFEKSLSALSGGQQKKVLLAASLCEPAHLYLWDEPLNYIDLLSRIQIEELLMRCQPTLLFVEHDRAFVERVATRVIEL